ncbi:MAG TPA: ABC transporter substrate-binding protein [Thermoanaerobaculia bacterium]|nr:ABC transporter substrate-binding protein [Thermoanaerobaculia bacterium]
MRRAVIPGLLLVISCARQEARPRPPVIGLFTGLSGPTAAWGEAISRGARLAAEDCKSATLSVEDDGGKPEAAANLAASFLGDPRVVAIVGADTTAGSLAASPLAEAKGVAMISPTASAPVLTKGKHCTFRVCATDDLEALAAARLARQRLNLRRVVILRDTRNDYSVGMAATFSAALPPIAVFDYAAGDNDFRAQLTSARELEPDALFVPGYYGDVAQIATQARDLGIRVPLLGGSGWDSPKLTEIGGKSLEGCWFVGWTRPALPSFVQRFRSRYGTEPDAAAAQGYDAFAIACSAAARGGHDRRAVRDAVASTRDFAGVSGMITIGPDGNAHKPLAVFRIADGRFVEEGTVNP